MSAKTYSLLCFAPDGEHVTEATNFPTIADAWERANNMGGRWFFYPICVVTQDSTIAAMPYGSPLEWVGRDIQELRDVLADQDNINEVLDFLSGEAPLHLWPLEAA